MKKEEFKNIAPKLAGLKTSKKVFKMPHDALEHTELSVLAHLKTLQFKNTFGAKNSFKVDSGYFENFDDSLFTSLEKQNLIKKNNSLSIPDNYFDTVELNVLLKLKEAPKENKVKIVSLYTKLYKYVAKISIAASVALFFIFNPFQQSKDITFDSLALSEIENWIEQDYLNLDAYQIAAIYDDVQVQPNLLKNIENEGEMENFLKYENLDELMYAE